MKIELEINSDKIGSVIYQKGKWLNEKLRIFMSNLTFILACIIVISFVWAFFGLILGGIYLGIINHPSMYEGVIYYNNLYWAIYPLCYGSLINLLLIDFYFMYKNIIVIKTSISDFFFNAHERHKRTLELEARTKYNEESKQNYCVDCGVKLNSPLPRKCNVCSFKDYNNRPSTPTVTNNENWGIRSVWD